MTFPPVPTDPLRHLAWRAIRATHFEFHCRQPWTCDRELCTDARRLGLDLVTPMDDWEKDVILAFMEKP